MFTQRGFTLTLVLALAAVAAVVAPSRDSQAGTTDPVDVVEQIFAEVNAGDAAGAGALVTEDFVLTDIDGGSFAVVGRPAFTQLIEDSQTVNLEITVVEIAADGNTVTGVADFADDNADAAGVSRYRQPFTVQVTDGGLASRGDFTYDLDDAQTVVYLNYVDSLEEDDTDEPPPPGLVTVPLSAQSGGNQPGNAFLFEEGGITGVGLDITPGPAGVQQPAYFYTGTCAAPGPIVEPLANVLDGGSFTLLSSTMAELVDTGLIINVSKSVAEPGIYVACGQVLSATAPPPAPTAAAPATPTPATGIGAPATGTGGDAAGGSSGALYALLAAAVAVALGAGALVVGRRRV